MGKVDQILSAEGAAAEERPVPDTLPDHVRVERPNLGRATVVSVRLAAEEHERIRHAADQAGLPVSTVLRLWALDRLRSDEERGTVEQRLERLERQVFPQTA